MGQRKREILHRPSRAFPGRRHRNSRRALNSLSKPQPPPPTTCKPLQFMKSNKIQKAVIPSVAAIALLALARPASATPYACDVTNAAGVVSFRLNENADNVKIISSGGAVTNDLGARVKGLTVTNLGIAAGVIKVMVTRSAPLGYTQITTDLFTNANGIYLNKFEQPRGVVVNK